MTNSVVAGRTVGSTTHSRYPNSHGSGYTFLSSMHVIDFEMEPNTFFAQLILGKLFIAGRQLIEDKRLGNSEGGNREKSSRRESACNLMILKMVSAVGIEPSSY